MARGSNPNSRKNLKRGGAPNTGKTHSTLANKCDANNTYAAIFHFIESREITEQEWQTLALMGIHKSDVIAAGITDYRKLKWCVNRFMDDSPAMAREVMQRSEPQDIGIAHSGKLTIEIIEDGTITFTTPTRGAIANPE